MAHDESLAGRIREVLQDRDDVAEQKMIAASSSWPHPHDVRGRRPDGARRLGRESATRCAPRVA